MTPRPSMSRAKRARIFRDNDGICHICGRRIAPGEPWHAEHVKARGFEGSDGEENLRPAHIDCLAGKTRKERKAMAKADHASLRHRGLKPKSRLAAQAEWARSMRREEVAEEADS